MFDYNLSYEILSQRLLFSFHWGLFLVIIITCLYVISPSEKNKISGANHTASLILSVGLTALLSFLMAIYPIQWGTFADREGYLYVFNHLTEVSVTDPIWRKLNELVHSVSNNQFFFFSVVAVLYVGLRYWACCNFNKKYSFLLFVMVISSFLFWSYGVNTIRSGVASSFLLLSFSVYNKGKKGKMIAFILAFASIGIHKSMALPALLFAIGVVFTKPKFYLFIWCMSFVLSAVAGGYFESILGNLIEQNAGIQAGGYILEKNTVEYDRGFRLDFILYSLLPILIGAYYIIKRAYYDKLYLSIYCTYLMANAFFVLVVRANFVDRFGYLSWFMMPIVLLYPLLKVRLFEKQNNMIALMLFFNVVFTIIMFLK